MQNQTEALSEDSAVGCEDVLCPLCLNAVDETFTDSLDIKIWICNHCELIFKDPGSRPSHDEERARYLVHQNNNGNQGYINFLKKAVNPAIDFIEPGSEGLDFGCGPNPVLSEIVKEAGFACLNYDPIFFPEFPDERMDFIFATECFEHFFNPMREMNLMTALLRPGGFLIIMTQQWKDKEQLADWWYMRDKTHVAFYHQKTFDYICEQFGYTIQFDDGEKVLILQKDVVRER